MYRRVLLTALIAVGLAGVWALIQSQPAAGAGGANRDNPNPAGSPSVATQPTPAAGLGANGAGGASGAGATTPAAVVSKEWKMEDLLPALDEVDEGRDFKKGEAMFDRAKCSVCHNMAG